MTDYLDIAIAYARAEPLIAGAAALVVLLLAVRRTKLFVFLVALALLCGAVLFVIGEMAGVGGAQKSRLTGRDAAPDAR